MGFRSHVLEPHGLFRDIFFFFLFLVVLLGPGSVSSWAAQSDDVSYLNELIDRAVVERLADEREWQVLLHYHRTLFGGIESMQDDPGFFLSPDGKTDSQAELAATLAKFFSDELVGRSKQPAQCAFIARYYWLNERLQFDGRRLPQQPCERFTRWFDDFNAAAITVIFPTGFMNNPSSMFGHTFLRVDGKEQTPQTRILAYTINYAAQLPPDAGIEYAVKGVFGAYPGYFSTIPYYLKVQEYRDIDNRDIWEYRLNLTAPQIRRLLMHAWELGNAYFDYFFFGENCAYHILSLIEVAEPSIHLLDRFPLYTIPVDTVRLLRESGLVDEVVSRPSRSTLVRRKRASMAIEERTWFDRLIRNPAELQAEGFRLLQPDRQAFVLETASDYLLQHSAVGGEEGAPFRDKNRTILRARSELKVTPRDVSVEPYVTRPDLGHGTSRISTGAGWRNHRAFEEATLRAAYQDLLDPEPGFTPNAQIEIMSVSVRHYHHQSQARVEKFSPINIVSLAPMDSLSQLPSWKVNLGMQTIRHNGCQLCSNGVFNGGIGAAAETHLLKREVYFAFAEAEANYSRAYEERHRIGGGGTVGMLTDVTDRWKLMLSGSYLRYALGDKSDDIRWYAGSRYTLSQNWALRLEYNHRDRDNDLVFSVQAFF
ncbi:MAG: DUF4105 domain-containing protein [Nitrospirota bacterium]|nr:DUF4105 domain-containing protein [Nitrospirota bacterium]